jgi:hypothetical protein
LNECKTKNISPGSRIRSFCVNAIAATKLLWLVEIFALDIRKVAVVLERKLPQKDQLRMAVPETLGCIGFGQP